MRTENTQRRAPQLLSSEQIRELSMLLCEDDEAKAGALLVLSTDIRQRADLPAAQAFPFYVVRQAAFSQCGNRAIDAQADSLRSELFGVKGGDA